MVKPEQHGRRVDLQFKTVMNPQCLQDAYFTVSPNSNPKTESAYGLLEYDFSKSYKTNFKVRAYSKLGKATQV